MLRNGNGGPGVRVLKIKLKKRIFSICYETENFRIYLSQNVTLTLKFFKNYSLRLLFWSS